MNNKSRKVFITNRGWHNYDKAAQYGELVAVTIGHVDLSATDRLEEKIQFSLRAADSADYLLLSGAPVINALAQAYLMAKFGFVNLIYHDPGKGTYTVRNGITGAEVDRGTRPGSITCPACGRVVAESPIPSSAVASEKCDLCKAEDEELTEREGAYV